MTAICMTNDLLDKLLYFLPITTRVRISPPAMVESGLVTRIMAPLSRRHCSSSVGPSDYSDDSNEADN